MKREHYGWFSPRLDRRMELLWFGDHGRPLLLFPSGRGSYGQTEEGGLTQSLAPLVDAGALQLCCVDSVDEESWYAEERPPRGRIQRHQQYDSYLAEELAPHLRERSGMGRFSVFGPSFGGFHAINFASRHPDCIDAAIAFSGFFDLRRILDGYWDEECYFHSPAAYIANMDQSWTARLGAIQYFLAAGEQDHLGHENREFAELLRKKGIACQLELWPGVGGHDWPYWREHLPGAIEATLAAV